jgi:hypothetical protein
MNVKSAFLNGDLKE